MNRFILDIDPEKAAQYHCDKHVVKMILEEAQMLSTAHRILDGTQYVAYSGRKIKRWALSDDRENILYKATHVNHPCTQWSIQTSSNYKWGFLLFTMLLQEYTFRYGKHHKSEALIPYLQNTPNNISVGKLTNFPQAMPVDCKAENSIDAYRNYYINYKKSFAKWTKRETPDWFT